ncbi:hypothetical protein FBZ98_1011054 [Rhizobium sp. ERR 922]|uniref:hypothetical protein n=1 Tax=unclassified Rhizobium TaxID=2613769 RepID=UPI00119DE94C|nr:MULTISPECIES: hypothetical protein [unclassified Rhizobium]TWB61709.1 hypothetical protein FBZ98_1011054 [Rhizobium sp. ERR 922]TWC04635.1 hypothetical protein FBZ97_1011054 [Rhizobium sp. ERR 942]
MPEELERPMDTVHVNHYCEHPGCKAWGGFGYDIGKGETKWFCFEHRWLDYRQPRYGDRPKG